MASYSIEMDQMQNWDRLEQSKDNGAAWVLKNERGLVLLHGRRSFAFVNSKHEVSFKSILWAVESILTLGCPKVIFAVDDPELVGAVSRPMLGPSSSINRTDF